MNKLSKGISFSSSVYFNQEEEPMRLTPTSINGSVLNNALAKMAARKVLASFSVPPETDWKKVKPLFAEALARASVEEIVEAEDI